jgi:sulfur relay (sulfurtransferase) complex TusBCD TusD component (DsrE family)
MLICQWIWHFQREEYNLLTAHFFLSSHSYDCNNHWLLNLITYSSIEESFMENFLFVLGKDDNEAATRCFQFAKIAHSKGHHVDMFFIDGGVMWANQDRDLSQKTDTGDCPGDYLSYLVENEVTVGICTPCAKNRGLDEAKFFTNMVLDGGPHLIDMAADGKMLKF